VRILALLGSDKDGERASAAKAADAFVRKHNLDWQDVIEGRAASAKAKAGRWHEVGGVDYLAAAESRIRQLQAHNMRLERQVRLLKEKLEGE